MIRAAVLVVVAICQMPLPIGHDHAVPGADLGHGALARHLALFHSKEPDCRGWHMHLIPPCFWNGGGASDATGRPAPEADGSTGVPLLVTVTADELAPTVASTDAAAEVDVRGDGAPGARSPVHFLQTFGPAAKLAGLLGVARC